MFVQHWLIDPYNLKKRKAFSMFSKIINVSGLIEHVHVNFSVDVINIA